MFSTELKMIVPQLGTIRIASNEKARWLLDWSPRGREESVLSTAERLVHLGLLKDSGTKSRLNPD